MPLTRLGLSSSRRSRVPVRRLFRPRFAAVVSLPLGAFWPEEGFEWRMIGHDVRNTRHQPFEWQIGRWNVERLRPKWELTTTGDVSATPAVVSGGHRHGGTALYFPDWGGTLWKVDAESGQVVWSRSIAEYNDIPGSISRTSPSYADGTLYVADLNGNMMAVDADTGDLRWITELDPNPNTIVTGSPVILGNRLYIATSSSGGGAARMTFPRQHDRAQRAHRAGSCGRRSSCRTTGVPAASRAARSSIRRRSTWTTAWSTARRGSCIFNRLP